MVFIPPKNKTQIYLYIKSIQKFIIVFTVMTLKLYTQDIDFKDNIRLSEYLIQNPDQMSLVLNDTTYIHSDFIENFSKDRIKCLINHIKVLFHLGYQPTSTKLITYHTPVIFIYMRNKNNLYCTIEFFYRKEKGKYKISKLYYSDITKIGN